MAYVYTAGQQQGFSSWDIVSRARKNNQCNMMFFDTKFVLQVCPGDILQLLRAIVHSPTHPSILPTVGSP